MKNEILIIELGSADQLVMGSGKKAGEGKYGTKTHTAV